MKIILASKSPRRKELFGKICKSFECITSDKDEIFVEGISIEDNILNVAKAKMQNVFDKIKIENLENEFVIISADTIVVIDNEILGKPKTSDVAVQMLEKLSGKTHKVITSVCIFAKREQQNDFLYQKNYICDVTFKVISKEQIEDYVKTGEPLDKAGAYAIQGGAYKFIENFTGDINTIIGLPINDIEKILVKEHLL